MEVKGNLVVDGVLASNIGGSVLLATYTPSAVASVDITSVITTEYDFYEIFFNLLPVNDDVELWVRSSTDNGATFASAAGSYRWQRHFGVGTNTAAQASASDTRVNFSNTTATGAVGNLADEGVYGHMTILNPGTATQSFSIGAVMHTLRAAADLEVGNCAGKRLAVGRINALRLLFETGNIASGFVTIYGRKQ